MDNPSISFIRVSCCSPDETSFNQVVESVLIPSHMLAPLGDVVRSMLSRNPSCRIVCDNVNLAPVNLV